MVKETDMVKLFKSSVCSSIELEELGINEHLVHTGFLFPDGDELHIVLKTTGSRWILTDEGHTLMWLSYEDYNMTPVRSDLLMKILTSNSVKKEDGRIIIEFEPENAGRALYSIVQTIVQISDLRFLDRKRVRSTFIEDMKGVFEKSGELFPRCRFDEEIEISGDKYKVDVFIDTKTPILVFGITNTENCRDAVINMLQLRISKAAYLCCAILENSEILSGKDRKRLLNTSDKTIEGLDEEAMSSMRRLVEKCEAGA
jgi:hypothetical protein